MKNINKQLIIILAVFLAILLGLFFGIAKPRFGTFANRYKALSENQNKLASLTAKKENLIKLKRDEKRIEEALKKAQGVLPVKEETSDFLVQLEAGSKDTGNDLKSVTVTEVAKKEAAKKEEEELGKQKTEEGAKPAAASPYQTIAFSISLSGNLKQLLDFLALSEVLSRFITYPSLTITSTRDNLIETKLNGEIYFKGS